MLWGNDQHTFRHITSTYCPFNDDDDDDDDDDKVNNNDNHNNHNNNNICQRIFQ